MGLEAAILAKLNQGGGGQTIDELLAKLPSIDAGTTADITADDLSALGVLFNSSKGAEAVAASATAMALITASPSAMLIVDSIPSAVVQMMLSQTGQDPTAFADATAVAANAPAVNAIVASPSAMAAVIGIKSARAALKSNTTVTNAIAADSTLLNKLTKNASASTDFISAMQATRATMIATLDAATNFTKISGLDFYIGASAAQSTGVGSDNVYIPTSISSTGNRNNPGITTITSSGLSLYNASGLGGFTINTQVGLRGATCRITAMYGAAHFYFDVYTAV